MSKKRPEGAGPRPDDPTEWVPRPIGSRHRVTLALILDRPVRPDIPWRDIEALLTALGGEISQGRGSRVRVALGPLRAVFHEPHPEPVTDKGAVESVREFPENLEVRPC
jgi:hypothetical protein